jgi:hypothetical protein
MSKEQQIPEHLEWFADAVSNLSGSWAIKAVERAYFRWLDTVGSARFIVDDATDPDEPIPYQRTDELDELEREQSKGFPVTDDQTLELENNR